MLASGELRLSYPRAPSMCKYLLGAKSMQIRPTLGYLEGQGKNCLCQLSLTLGFSDLHVFFSRICMWVTFRNRTLS